jgi:uncharacterized protein
MIMTAIVSTLLGVRSRFVLLLLAGIVVSGIGSCEQTNTNPSTDAVFDRRAFLRSISSTIIIPAYRTAQTRMNALQTAVQAFTETPTASTLRTAQTAWADAYKAWIPASPFNFGPADGSFGMVRQNIATFPINAALTERFITDGVVDLNNFNRDTRGLLGIEYLLFATGSTASALEKFSGEAGASRRRYLTAITNDVKTRLDAVAGVWLATGADSYAERFAADNGTNIGSSTSLLFNEFVTSYEELKNFKFGLPLGLRPGQTRTEADKVEGLYSGLSLEFARLHLEAVQSIWYGRQLSVQGNPQGSLSPNPNAVGFEQYLASVAGGNDLITSTKSQLAALNTAFTAIPVTTPMSVLVAQNHPSLIATYSEMQKQTRFFKSDMSSLLGISITFSSGDGD